MSTRPILTEMPEIPERGLYDLIFTGRGFIRGGRYDPDTRWHHADCLGKGDSCTCSAEDIDRHYRDKADIDMEPHE